MCIRDRGSFWPSGRVACPIVEPGAEPGRPSQDKAKGLVFRRALKAKTRPDGRVLLFGGEGGMIRHCVAHPLGAAVGRSSQQAALLEPGEGSHPPSMGIRFCCATRCKKPTLRSVFQFGGEGGIRTLDTLPYTHFPGVLLQPLGHLTKFSTAV